MIDIGTANTCICCNCSSPVFSFSKQTSHGEFSIIRCPLCYCSYVWPRPDSDQMIQYYRDNSYSNLTYEEAIHLDMHYHPNSATDSIRIINKCRKLAIGNRFLDVGAGFGPFSKTATENGFNVTACEPNPNSRYVFKQINGFEPDSCMLDQEYAKCHKERFDVVLLSQVLEHVTDLDEIVHSIFMVLRKNGIAAIAVPHFGSALSKIQGKKDMYISPPEHLNFFSKQGLVSLFNRYSFKLEYLETVSKVNRGKIEEAVKIPLVSHAVWRGLYSVLKTFELFGLGMVINGYFRKI